jgi:formate dehydrogenase major subunit/formate dehydrogenase alpha subunit
MMMDPQGQPVQMTINDQPLEARPDQTVLQAARANGITIPTLCYHWQLAPHGGCRLCMVEVEGARLPQAACMLPVREGMVVHTETAALARDRRTVLEMLAARYNDAGYASGDRGETEFERWLHYYGVAVPQHAQRHPVDSDPNPFVWVDMNKCILCTRCVRVCAEVQGRFVWRTDGRGYDTRLVAGVAGPMLEARCESCGACVAVCPTGALDNKMSVGLGRADKVVTTTCTYCGVGCQLDLNVKDNRIIRVTSSKRPSVNGLALCVKGRYGYDFVHHPDRLTRPRVRSYLLEGGGKRRAGPDRGEWVEVDWDTALNITARKLREARDNFGPDSVGLLASAKCLNEENYLMNKLARQVIGTNNIDHCARL